MNLREFFAMQFDRITVLSDLPLPPSVNKRLAKTHVGRLKAARNVVDYYANVGWLTRHQHARPGLYGKDDRLAVLIEVADCGLGRPGDLSNRLKALEDAITRTGIWHDDGNIDTLIVDRLPPAPPHGMANVFIGVLR